MPLAVWIVLAAGAALSAGALVWGPASVGGAPGRWLTPRQVAAEYRAEAAGLDLAPGWTWPARVAPAPAGPDGAPMKYQAGYGAGQADTYWFCSWASVVVSGKAPAAARERALRRIPGVYRTALFTEHLVADPQYFRAMIDAAESGDTTQLRDFVRANSPQRR